MLLQLCNEALLILESQPEMLQSEEVRILNRFLKEQSITHEESGKLLPKPKGEIESGSLQSAHDEDATYRTKGAVGQSGYVLEISEICDKENPFQLIADYAVEANNVSGSEILQGRLDDIKENTGCMDMYVDGGFHSEMEANKKENVSKRSDIERSNSALKSKGLKKFRVREKVKSTIVCGLRVTAQNIKRFVKFLQGGLQTKNCYKKA